MKKAIILILVLVSIFILLIRFADFGLQTFLGAKLVGGMNILSMPSGATVYLDEAEVGKTPYEDKNLTPKEYAIKIAKADLSWQGRVKLTGGTVTVVSRDLAKDFSSSAGETLTLEKGSGATIISSPDGASVDIDGKSRGSTPVSLDLASGEYLLTLSRPNYLKRSIRAYLPEGYRLVISADLALSEADLTQVVTPPISQTPEVQVKETPTGFLRVRDKPSLAGKEISQVKPGDTLILLEELSGWFRVRLSNGSEGYVSSSYVEKKPQEKI
ncbi:PEGA domain-containing protein [Candidatus Daviesbacteria bacterium]|nr:PEGA domain-containing protein [Candidatus Daviesbacteria bacterium]